MFRHLIDVKLYFAYGNTYLVGFVEFVGVLGVTFNANEEQTGCATLLQVAIKSKLTFEVMRINTSFSQPWLCRDFILAKASN